MNSSIFRLATRTLAKDMTFLNDRFMKYARLTLCNVRDIHITSNLTKEFRAGSHKVRSHQDKNTILDGETSTEIRPLSESTSLFPDNKTLHAVYNGTPYNKLHVINVKSTPNNTIMSLTDWQGKGIITLSAGCIGFKNTKKGTNIAAQQTALTFGNKAIELGITTAKLRVQGIGPGRMGAIKGIQLTGMTVVSITDDTRVSWNPPRPRKQRRV